MRDAAKWIERGGGRRRFAGLLVAAGAMALAMTPVAQAAEMSRDRLWRFVDDVLLARTYAEEEEAIRRWVRSPSISLDSERDDDGRVFAAVIAEVNAALRGTGFSLKDKGRDNYAADLIVAVVTPDQVVELAGISLRRHYGGQFDDVTAFTAVSENDDFTIDRGMATLSKTIEGAQRHASILRQIVAALGAGGGSRVFPSSIFFTGEVSDPPPTHLAPVDGTLLRFLYHRLKPGDTWVAVRKAFDRHWPN